MELGQLFLLLAGVAGLRTVDEPDNHEQDVNSCRRNQLHVHARGKEGGGRGRGEEGCSGLRGETLCQSCDADLGCRMSRRVFVGCFFGRRVPRVLYCDARRLQLYFGKFTHNEFLMPNGPELHARLVVNPSHVDSMKVIGGVSCRRVVVGQPSEKVLFDQI